MLYELLMVLEDYDYIISPGLPKIIGSIRWAEVLNIAREEEVIIKRRGGGTFTIVFKKTPTSPFDIPGIKIKATIC